MTTLYGVKDNVLRQLAMDSSPERPNLVLFDVQPDQVAPLETFLAERGAAIVDQATIVSARLSALDGKSLSERIAVDPDDREAQWALLREYRLSYTTVFLARQVDADVRAEIQRDLVL
ncbi:MAG: hypothetical protein P8R42_12440 [Candidatus Binatia bacterium]|nr:hypothetical protein [Candidatus Binatia bacterium]